MLQVHKTESLVNESGQSNTNITTNMDEMLLQNFKLGYFHVSVLSSFYLSLSYLNLKCYTQLTI